MVVVGGSYLSEEMQSVYSTAPVDWAYILWVFLSVSS